VKEGEVAEAGGEKEGVAVGEGQVLSGLLEDRLGVGVLLLAGWLRQNYLRRSYVKRRAKCSEKLTLVVLLTSLLWTYIICL
jgi:hypothetical protein